MERLGREHLLRPRRRDTFHLAARNLLRRPRPLGVSRNRQQVHQGVQGGRANLNRRQVGGERLHVLPPAARGHDRGQRRQHAATVGRELSEGRSLRGFVAGQPGGRCSIILILIQVADHYPPTQADQIVMPNVESGSQPSSLGK